MDNPAAAVEARGLRKRYGELIAVDGVDLSVDEGEVYALVGPNGAGKTTLVRCLTGTTEPTAGDVSVLNSRPSAVDRVRLGLLPQQFTPPDRLTARELVEYYSGLYPEDRVRETSAVLDEVGLKESDKQRYRDLSGGQKRRLLVAASIVNDPDLLFLDEPTTGIDPAGRREVWRVVEELSSQGTTVFLTTHYMEEASELSDRVGLMHQGSIVEEGAADELVAEHGGGSRFTIETEETVDAVAGVLEGYSVRDEDGLAIVEDVSLETVSKVLDLLESSDVTVQEFNWHTPDLEDVYMELAGEDCQPTDSNIGPQASEGDDDLTTGGEGG